MSATGLVRTQYWNVSGPNPTPRSGMTSRAESRTDVEGYILAADAARTAATYGYGVADGLQVSATAGETAITVAPGVALDGSGQIVVLAEGGLAIVDPFVGPGGVQNIPTVQVEASGVAFDTTGLAGDLFFTITWREVEEATSGLLVLNQAPWLRLVDPATYVDDGLQLVLAVVSLGTGGVVDALDPGARRYVGMRASRLELRLPGLDPAGPTVGQRPAAELAVRTDGGVDLNLLPSASRALSVLGGNGAVEIAAGLRVGGPTALGAGLTVAAGIETDGDLTIAGDTAATGDLAVAGRISAGSDLAVVGNAALAGQLTAAGAALTTLSVSGGADLGSNLTVHGTETIGIDLVVSRNVLVDGRIGVRKTNPAFELDVAGTICANTFCNPSDLRVKSDVRELGDVLDRLADVRAVTFVPAQADLETPVRRHAGVVAQEVAESLPELVIPMGPDGLMAVDYAGLAGVLVGAVNELRAVAAELSERVAELEDRRDVRG
ncbi:tail fiber domain-containing protein [Kribbella sp. NPDC026611]|uniref:tail fiber domain-containing protein n=1 Tax=Kribbella sp. NPDC026611 TaxID=3154911 RepID=UPI0033F3285F